MTRGSLLRATCVMGLWALLPAVASLAATTRPPNIILILADDLGYGDLGCYGQMKVKTPNLDRMAGQGMRFTQFYAGATVCAPSRCVLMTGLHTGHCRVRGNGRPPQQSLNEGDVTVASVLKKGGYATALIGKWGLGDEGFGGLPNDHGFDYFFGYLNQVHAHNYYPQFLWRNAEKVPLRNKVKAVGKDYGGFQGGVATERVQYSHDMMIDEALRWVSDHRSGPFFLYLALTIPHANGEAGKAGMEVPDLGEYQAENWPEPEKGKAAMISRMDRDIGRLLEKVRELGIEGDTVVLFASDNGPHTEGGVDPKFLNSSGPLRGIKRDLYEGGIRVPLIVRWPRRVEAGRVTDQVGYFGDFLPTVAELAGLEPPAGLDGLSLVPTLLGQTARQGQHEYLYWESYERRGARAVRFGDWKAVRPSWDGPIELYDLSRDLGETRDLAEMRPGEVSRAEQIMDRAHRPSESWKPPIRPR